MKQKNERQLKKCIIESQNADSKNQVRFNDWLVNVLAG